MPAPEQLRFEDVRPHWTGQPTLNCGRSTSPQTWAGYFYCAVPKYGQVFVEGNKEPFRDFPVQGQWIMGLLQARKITAVVARQLVFQVAHGVKRLLDDLTVVERELEEQRVLQAQRAAQAALAGQLSSARIATARLRSRAPRALSLSPETRG